MFKCYETQRMKKSYNHAIYWWQTLSDFDFAYYCRFLILPRNIFGNLKNKKIVIFHNILFDDFQITNVVVIIFFFS